MQSAAVFFDRDNTLNIDPGYLGNPEEVKLFEGVGEGIYKLKNECGFKIIVVSNQSGISRGLITHNQVKSVNNRINELLKEYNTSVDAFYYCPYHPEFNSPEKSQCRKPSPQMILQAAEDLDIDLSRSYLVGDSSSDIESGINAGLKTILINYENDNEKIISLKKRNKTPNFTTCIFLNACNYIIDDSIRGNQING
ncbi:MAG: HAD family hydrolase [Chlorobi bacterium]|nr:HAD family hydrolase [Chlorobiota bacterium]